MNPSGSPYQSDDEEEAQDICASLSYMQELKPRSKKGKNYTKKYLAAEDAALELGSGSGRNFGDLNEVEEGSTISNSDDGVAITEKLQKVRKAYFEAKPISNLIIDDFKEEILSQVQENDVVLLTGPTGCGKSTQVPQYLLEESINNLEYCNIVATQPRRVAAISIARRICDFREWELGTLCGFKVGLKDRTSSETMLTLMTTGILLQTLINKKSLNQFTHIILDEIHERDQSMDFLLIVIKKLLNENPNNSTKIILMSATVNAQKFASYFPKYDQGELTPCPIVTIDRPTKYTVDIHYLDDLPELGTVPNLHLENAIISKEAYDICIKLIEEFERLEKDEKNKNAVLVFLPGIYEIEQLYYKLTDLMVKSNGEHEYDWSLLPLHSSVTTEEQTEVFLPSKPGSRKIILSTNIAESSITVPGVKYVIDFCLMKRMKNDPTTNFNGLQMCWASQANCIQRAGRTGRLMDGKVYRMVPKSFYEELDEECKPEMLDAPLDKIVLLTKMLDMGEPKAVLALALDPPDLGDIEWTVLTLKEAGGLLRYRGGVYTSCDGDITFLGRLMALLPVDIHISKFIALGHVFGCLDDCIIIGATMNAKNIFSYPFRDRLRAYELKCGWAGNSFSDCIALLNAYNIWNYHHESGFFERSKGENEVQWTARNFLRLRVLRETKLLVEEIKLRLKELDFEEVNARGNPFNNDFEKMLLIKLAIAGGFYPNYYSPGYRYGETLEAEAARELGGQNPFTTVMLHGFPSDQPMELYFDLIKDRLSDWSAEMRLHPHACSKILVEFRPREVGTRSNEERTSDLLQAGKIPEEVYRALKTRHLKIPIDIKLLPPYEAKQTAERLGLACWNENRNTNRGNAGFIPRPIPELHDTFVHIVISHVEDPGHFWAVYDSAVPTQELIHFLIEENLPECKPFENTPILGQMCIAQQFKDQETRYYRARVESVELGFQPSAKVFFVDQGCYGDVDIRMLRQCGPDLLAKLRRFPNQSFECVLSGIRPSSAMDPEGRWTRPALNFFMTLVDRGRLYGQVHSIVGGVLALELHNIDKFEDKSNINEILISENFAERTNEPRISRASHRLGAEASQNDDRRACADVGNGQLSSASGKIYFDETKLTVDVLLRGPTNPLEMTLYSNMRSALSKSVSISEDSINSVLLNVEPSKRHDRLIVAGIVNHNPDGSRLTINQTTVMPNIPGLPALVHLIFAPEVEYRVSKGRTNYTGILCGLGVDPKGRSLFPEHDIEVRFDSEITAEDVGEVNSVRMLMSKLLQMDYRKHYSTRLTVLRCQNEVRSIILRLFSKQRRSIEPDPLSGDYDWRRATPDPDRSRRTPYPSTQCTIFPTHPALSLSGLHS